MPQYRPTTGKLSAATPKSPYSSQDSAWPTGPPASSQIARTDRRPMTTDAIPRASRAHGERIWWTGVFGGDWRLEELLVVDDLFEPPDRVGEVDARDVERRREGEVFVGMAQQSDASRLRCKQAGQAGTASSDVAPRRRVLGPAQTSMTTGRITGLRCVTSRK